MLAKSFWDLKKKQAEDTLNSKDHKNKANHSMVINKKKRKFHDHSDRS
jgi:hypothetical protein